jgi:3-hydroxy-D-aspartate aldolase
MNKHSDIDVYEVGYNIPAKPGMDAADIQTPCLMVEMDVLEENLDKMQKHADDMGVRLRVHGKMHKSADIARMQIERGACGICCQKVSEAEAFAREGIKDILVSNQVRDPAKIDRLARLPKLGARTLVCVDDIDNVADLSAAAVKHGTEIEVLVEIDCGAGRCGVTETADVVAIAKAVDAAEGLKFSGIQAYQGAMQHLERYEDRKAKIDIAVAMVREAVDALKAEGLECDIVGGGGTGSYYFEGTSGVYNELQCGSYAFMDADYGRILDENGKPISETQFASSLFLLTSVMSHAKPDKAVVDAGLKAQSVDSGLPKVHGIEGVEYVKCSDEHGVIADPEGKLKINQKIKLIPGHCDPTCNVHDWYVLVRDGKVENVIPVTARGLAY